jgi:hypothetical protein
VNPVGAAGHLSLAGSIIVTGLVVSDAGNVPGNWSHGRIGRGAALFELAVIGLAAAGNVAAVALLRSAREAAE